MLANKSVGQPSTSDHYKHTNTACASTEPKKIVLGLACLTNLPPEVPRVEPHILLF